MKDAKATAVGAFVLGGLLLGAAAVLMFGGVRLFDTELHAVAYFPGSVAGLSVGAPVTFRGVKVGSVEGMRLRVDLSHPNPIIPVTLDLDPSRISWTNGTPTSSGEGLARAVAAGLRAQLVAQSLVTGQLGVDLDFRPGTPASRVGVDGRSEIPTVPSDLQHLKDQLAGIDLPQLAERARAALASLQAVTDGFAGRIGPVSDAALLTAAAARETLQATTAAVRAAQADAARTLGDIDLLAVSGRSRLTDIALRLDRLSGTADQALGRTAKLAADVDDMVALRSPVRTDLAASLRDLAASASSLRSFTRDLARNPAGTLLGTAPR